MAAATKETVTPITDISNIKLVKVDEALMLKNLLKVTGWASGLVEGMDKEELARQLQMAYRKTGQERNSLVSCDTCGGFSDANTTTDCPFCGDKDGGDNPAEAGTKEEAMTTKETKKNGEGKRPSRVASKSAAAAPKNGEAKKANGEAKKKGDKPKTSTAIVEAKGVELATVTVEQLDAAVAEVKRLDGNALHNYWELGNKLAEINETRMWTARVDEKGKPIYKDWSAFCDKEFGFSAQWANRLIAVGTGFDAKQIEGVESITKLGIIVKVPPADRMPLLQMAKEGATKSQLAAQVAKIPERAAGRSSPSGKGRQAGNVNAGGRKPSKPAVQPVAKSGQLTAVLTQGRHRVPLFARATKAGEDPKPAKSIKVDPHGELECVNGVKLKFRLMTNGKGEFVLAVETKREKDD